MEISQTESVKLLGGKFYHFLYIEFNGHSLYSENCLCDTGAGGYAFVSHSFADQLKDLLWLEEEDLDKPVPVQGYDGTQNQCITTGLCANMILKRQTFIDIIFLVIDMPHDMILGLKFFTKHQILLDCFHKVLIFLEDLP